MKDFIVLLDFTPIIARKIVAPYLTFIALPLAALLLCIVYFLLFLGTFIWSYWLEIVGALICLMFSYAAFEFLLP